MTDQPECVLRTHLCDGQQVLDLTRAPSGRCRCYCATLAEPDRDQHDELAQYVRSARARTVARAPELERMADRHDRVTRPVDW